MIIVQIGANKGDDSCSDFVIKNKGLIEEVHLVEPLATCNTHINNVYKDIANVKIYNLAITDNPILKEMTIYYPKQDNMSGHSSSIYSHLTAHSHAEIEFVTVSCFTLEDFFLNNGINKCDRLYIDTEGLDCKILLGFDFNKYNIRYIEFEIIHADGTFNKGESYNKCIAKFIENGYRIEAAGDFNECAVKND